MAQTYDSSPLIKIKCEDENDYSIQLIRWFLKPIGAWPKSETSSNKEKLLTYTLMFMSFATIVCPMVPCFMYLALEEELSQYKIRAVGPVSFWLMASIKYFLLIYHEDNIKKCLQNIQNDWSRIKIIQDRQIMLTNAKFGRYVASSCLICMYCGVCLFYTARWFSKIVTVVGNESITYRVLPLPFYNGIIDTRFSPAYEVVFSLQFFSCCVVNSVTVGACGLAATFVMHACGQLSIVMSWIQNITKDSINFQWKQAEIVKQHLRALSFVSRIEDIMHQICLVEITGCTLNMCLIGYYFMAELERKDSTNFVAYPIMFTSITFNIFIFCYIGEIVSEQCRQVGEAAYMTEWYRLPEQAALDFILIILRSRLVTNMTAGKLIQLSIATFGGVFRASLAYLNMLRQIMS